MIKNVFLFVFTLLLPQILAAQTIPDGRYAIINLNSDLALDVAGASTENGAKVQQWGYSGGDWQHFEVTYQGSGYYSIRPAHSDMSLDVYEKSREPGGEIRQWKYTGADNQLWAIDSTSNGYYTITSKLSGLALDVWEWSTNSGGEIRQHTLAGGANQQFRFQAVDDGLSTIGNGRYVISSRWSGRSVEVASAGTENGANVQQWSYGGQPWQQWTLQYQGNGFYSVRAVHSGKALEVYGMSLDSGANIVTWDYWGGDGQLWKVNDLGNGYHSLTSKLSGMALDVWGWSTNNGGDIRQYDYWGGESQQFRLAPANAVADGFASLDGGTTGGAGGATVTVNSCSELQSALGNSDPLIIQIPNSTIDCRTASRAQAVCPVKCSGSSKYTYRVPVGTQTCRELGSSSNATTTKYRNDTRLHVTSNKTIVGLGPNSTLRGGSFVVSGEDSNLIFRNFTITGINPHLVEAGGGISMNNADHIWIDHMRFSQISDGYTDMVNTKNVTLSWNHFDGYNTASCDNHHSYTMFADDTSVTFHHNYFDQGGGRNPKLNKSETRAHLYNNYWYDITYFATNAGNGAQAKIEGNYYENVSRPHWNESGYMDANKSSNVYAGRTSSSSYADTGNRVFSVPYRYSLESAESLPSVLKSQTGPQ